MIPERIRIDIVGKQRPHMDRQLGLCDGLTTCGIWKQWLGKIRIDWDMSPDTDPMDTLVHELVHAMEYIFNNKEYKTHTKKFYRIIQFLKKEFKIK